MNAIFASKLFRGSTRQEKIRAALADPVNTELVLQLKEYLDVDSPDDATVDVLPVDDAEPTEAPVDESELDDDNKDNEDNKDDTTDDKPVDSSTEIDTTTADNNSEVAVVGKLADDMNVIKGMLNSRDDTDGVVVIKIHGDEMWIHYNDNTNLNTVMEPVISLLYSSGYDHLEFNRLARSENAIVFVVSVHTPPTDGESND